MKNHTGKFQAGDTVKLIDPASLANGIAGTVTEINLSGRGYPYRVNFGVHHAYHPESELGTIETAQPQRPPVAEYQSMDIDSGLGIGGVGSDDYSMATEHQPTGPQFRERKSSGQLWQPCKKHDCSNEPVCLDCEYCDDHCHCGE